MSGTDTISFDLLVDGSNSYTVTIDANTINSALSKPDGTVSNDAEFADVLRYAFGTINDVARVITLFNGVRIQSVEATGSSNSSIELSGVTSNFASGNFGAGLENGATSELADDYPQWSFGFSGPFTVYRDVEFSFDIQVGSDPATTITVTRDMVDTALGTSDGKIISAGDMAKLLDYALDGEGLDVTASGASILFDIDKTLYPDAGRRATMQIDNVTDNIGPAPDFDILDVDITDPANGLDNYLSGVDAMLQKVISGAATLGAVKTRIDMQESFTRTLMDSIDKGIGRLIDADMNQASARLKALQTQEQLAIQSLQIANSNAENILQLFR
ncbi:hypothetical protein CN109_39030 [Sinorhizobium meliloti]|nr:hypothetical protein CN109_39030 [Sinorhizobium meliloti]